MAGNFDDWILAISVHTAAMRPLNKLARWRIKAEIRKQQQFFELAERFRNASDPEEVKRLGDQLGRMVFGN